ncbi:hypothetical protein [Gordonia effusa]|uniref:hypothetical protein n=1 Tax=Gordonia effusa TaxID=263908 RepID=UPI00147946D6|nr:hypothetical protein [Gordonia effusa]
MPKSGFNGYAATPAHIGRRKRQQQLTASAQQRDAARGQLGHLFIWSKPRPD